VKILACVSLSQFPACASLKACALYSLNLYFAHVCALYSLKRGSTCTGAGLKPPLILRVTLGGIVLVPNHLAPRSNQDELFCGSIFQAFGWPDFPSRVGLGSSIGSYKSQLSTNARSFVFFFGTSLLVENLRNFLSYVLLNFWSTRVEWKNIQLGRSTSCQSCSIPNFKDVLFPTLG